MRQRILPSLAVAASAAAFFAFPLIWMLLTSLRPPAELWDFPPWLPSRPDPSSLSAVLAAPGFLRCVANSLGLSLFGSAAVLALAAPAAYALARSGAPRRQGLLMGMLALSLLPPICLVGGLYRLYSSLGWVNQLPALLLPLCALQLPFAVWMLTPALAKVPREMEEAAWLDGCSRGRAFTAVILPAARSALVSVGLLSLAFYWNEFLVGFSLTFDERARPATVAVALLQGSYHQPWGELCAAAVLCALPLGALALLLQGRLVAGLTAGLGKED